MGKKAKLWHVWARRMREDGASLQEIADTFGKSIGTAHYAIDPHGRSKGLERVNRSAMRRRLEADPVFKDQAWVSWLSNSP